MTAVVAKVSPPDRGLTLTATRTPVATILVVDDDEDTRALLRYVMESHHYHVIEATDGEEAVNLAEAVLPDLIIMDTNLKLMNGLDATSRIRSASCTREIPIVFLSGHAQPQARAEALATGANDYLVKPVALDELEKVVEQQLSRAPQEGNQPLHGFLSDEGKLL